MSYREEARELAIEGRWTVLRFLPLFLLIILILGGVGFSLKWFGMIGNTVVEREVFERSYQRSEGLKSEIATNRATLVQIEQQLVNPNLDQGTRFNLEAQKRAIEIRIETARRKQ